MRATYPPLGLPAPPGGLGPPGVQPTGTASSGLSGPSPFGTGHAGAAGGIGSLLHGSTPGRAIVGLLEQNASAYTWVASTVGSNTAAGYQLATDDPVMAIGGFNGTDPAPTLPEFQQFVREHKVHYFIAGGVVTGSGGNSATDAGRITTWVEDHFRATTVDGVTIYDLAGSPR